MNEVDISEFGFSVLQIETKSLCNMQCKFCPYPLRENKNDRLSSEIFSKLVDSLKLNDSFKYIALSQFNEPLMDDRIYGYIRCLKTKKIPVMITTNGLLLSNDKIRNDIVAASPDYIKLSLQTLNEKLFYRSRGIQNSFDVYKKGVLDFLKSAAEGPIQVTIDLACNFLSPFKSFKNQVLGLERGDPSVYNTVFDLRDDLLNFLRGWKSNYPSFIIKEHDLDRFFKKINNSYLEQGGFKIADNICIKIKQFWFGRRIKNFFPVYNPKGCHDQFLGILANGDVVPCCLAYGDMVCLGNLNKATLKDILEKQRGFIERLRKGINMPDACRRCLGAPTKRGAILKNMKNLLPFN